MNTKRLALVAAAVLCVAATARADTPKYQTIVEPNEKAFSFLLPEGWKSTGGVIRTSLLGYGVEMYATSPDGKVTIGSSTMFPLYAEPTLGGYPVGYRYSPGMGVIVEIEPYTPAAQFLTKVVIPKRVGKFTVTRTVNRPDLVKQAWNIPGTVAADAAEVEYRFERNGQPYVGGLLCTTGMSNFGGFRSWRVGVVTGFEAPQDRVEEAKKVLVLIASTLRINPIWLNAELKGSADRAKVVQDLVKAQAEMIDKAYWQRSQQMDSIFKRGSDVRRGTVDLYDPTTGTVMYGRANRYQYYWVNNRGDLVGNDTDSSPGVDYHHVTILP